MTAQHLWVKQSSSKALWGFLPLLNTYTHIRLGTLEKHISEQKLIHEYE